MAISKVFATGKEFEFGVLTAADAAAAVTAKGSFCAGISTIVSADFTGGYDTNITAKDEDGDVVAHAFGNLKYSGSIEGYATVTATLPVAGAVAVIRGKYAKVMSVTVTASNEDWLKVKVDCEGYEGLSYT